MRDYYWIDRYLDELRLDIYPQPQDKGHTAWAQEMFDRWSPLWEDAGSVLDVGCGEAFMQSRFESKGLLYVGVTLGKDYQECIKQGKTVREMDFHFLDLPDEWVGMVFSRHSLEHSPMPLLALMEWHRVSRKYLCLAIPNPAFFGEAGRNHYSVMTDKQTQFLLRRSGWAIVETAILDHEFQYFCAKVTRDGTEYRGDQWD